MVKRERLTDEALLAAVSAAEEAALGGASSEVASDREDAIKRYYGRPYGDELPGRSSVISRDVADVIEGVVANVVKPFVGGDQVVQFDPVGPEDEQAAEQETDYVNFVALERNNGFVWLVSAIKDALWLRNGYVKCHWATRQDVITETYEGKTDEEVALMLEDDGIEVMEHTEYPDPIAQMAAQMHQPANPAMAMMGGQQPSAQQPPQVPMLHDIKVRRVKPTAFVQIDPCPPDELVVSERARTPSVQEVDFVQHRTRKMISDLRQAGYDIADDISDDDHGDTMEDMARQRFGQGNTYDDATGTAARRIVMFKESYIRIDRDGDGVAELRRICQVGQTLLADDECDIVPIAAFSGVLVPHQHLGLSVYDLVEDVAKIKTALMRSYLDNRYLQNNGRYAINSTNVNLDDFLVSRPGGVVRVDGDPSANVMPLVAPDTSAGALQGLEYLDSVREQRTGYTRNSAGIDNNALTNRTAMGMSMQLSQSQLRLEMIARTMAETGVRDVFKIVHALTLKHSSQEEKVRLKGKWVAVNPREWIRRADLSISIGLGTGTPEQQLGKLMALMPVFQQAQQAGLVGVQQVYNIAQESLKLTGYKAPDKFLKPPQTDPQTGQVKEPQPPPPEAVQVAQIKAQADQQALQAKTQADAQKFQAEQAASSQKMSLEMQVKEREQQNNLALQASNDQRDNQKMQLEHERELQRMAIEAALKEKEMLLDAELKREEIASKERVGMEQAQIAAQASVYAADRSAETTKYSADSKKPPEKKPPKGYKVIRGKDGRAAQLDVIQ